MEHTDFYIIIGKDWHGVEHFIGSFEACCGFVAWIKTCLFKSRFRYANLYYKIYCKSYWDLQDCEG